ncbi:hypothetical protein Lalb_Chr14g0365681 [Lupinus albus]|uniref:Clavata3/ESR (CLE) gene family member n=1 Tax=Lupinus albus TaxID=3870 RepID=A0A6A4PBE7_LUPAL|nr:hypothetical protein Lalb_Chr14g0365681 [Lupinus albus]
MIWQKSKNQRMSFLIISLLLLVLLLSTTPCITAEKNRFKGGSSSSKLKSSEYHVEFQGNKADKYGGDQVFGAEERKVYTGPNPLHNR